MLNRLGEFVREGLYLEDVAVETTVTITCFSDIDDLSTLTESIIIADNTLSEITELNLYECRRLRTLQIGDELLQERHSLQPVASRRSYFRRNRKE